ncbi:P-loop ATPase, Sll1717 family [Proteus mirabilis]|uniref:P-loop ATPase, Sll1717 family n=1 Tax=Proteus mirabilis TaxID=584 RepID=UPI0034D40F73
MLLCDEDGNYIGTETGMDLYKFKSNDQIGSLDAETDHFLSECFLESSVYDTLKKFDNKDIDFVKRIIVGRTGSGKTAILKMLSNDSSIKKSTTIEAESTVFEHINNNVFISKLADSNVDLRVFYKSLWIHVLLVKVIEIVYSNEQTFLEKIQSLGNSKKRKYNLDLAKEYLEHYKDNFFNDKIVAEITEKFQDEVGLSIGNKDTIFGASLKVSDEQVAKIQRETARYVSANLLKKQKELIKFVTEESPDETQSRIIISIDDLDKSWLSNSTIRYDFINALLDAFKELIDLRSVKILISIRTDILMGIYNTNLRQEEKDRSLIIPIEWSRFELSEILDKRIDYLVKHKYASKKEVKFSDIFNFSVKNESASDYILDRTMLRPRDAIDFVNFCLMQGDGRTSLNEDMVIEAEERYYTSRKMALNKEWMSQYPNVLKYIDAISLINIKKFKIEELNKDEILIYVMENSSINNSVDEKIATDIKLLVNVWFTIGIIGIEKTKTLTVYSSFDKPILDITDYNKTFVIHPLFYRV